MSFIVKNNNAPFSLFNIAGAFCVALSLSACGASQKVSVKNLDLSTSDVGGVTYLNMSAIVNLGNLQFPNIEVPILNPTRLSESFGQMSLQHLPDGNNQLTVAVNYQEATKLNPSLGGTLPNGRELPTSLGVGNAVLVGIPVINQSRVYVGGELNKDIFVGAAIAIPAFDSAFRSIPFPLNIFLPYTFSPQISGAGGLFSSTQAGGNGIAVFVKRSLLPTPAQPQPALPTEAAHVNNAALQRLNTLFNKKATLRVK